ncbi:unnamed protein product, partial [Mesorhabditis spiculigera]
MDRLLWLLGVYLTVNIPSISLAADETLSSHTICPKVPGHHQKTCPDFKDFDNQSYCCPSNLQSRGYFCCTLNQVEEFKAQARSKEWQQFFSNYLTVLILGSVLGVCLSIFATSLLCKKLRICPLYHDPAVAVNTLATSGSMYRPVDTIPPTKIYEAPPPYDAAFSDRSQNDWNCLVENEINGDRRIPPPTVPGIDP